MWKTHIDISYIFYILYIRVTSWLLKVKSEGQAMGAWGLVPHNTHYSDTPLLAFYSHIIPSYMWLQKGVA